MEDKKEEESSERECESKADCFYDWCDMDPCGDCAIMDCSAELMMSGCGCE